MSELKTSRQSPARGLSSFEVMRLRFRLRRSACSETWVADQIITVIDISPDGEQLRLTCFDSRVFPPGGRQATKMRWCRACGRYTPPQAIHQIDRRRVRLGPILSATLMCDDCLIADDYEAHREIYEAGLHLKPASSQSFVLMRNLFADRAHAR